MESQLVEFVNNIDITKYDVTLALFRNVIEFKVAPYIKVIDLKKNGKLDISFQIRLYKLIKNGGWDYIISKIAGVNEHVMLSCGISSVDNVMFEFQNTGEISNQKNLKRISTIFPKRLWSYSANSKKAINELKILFKKEPVYLIYNGIDTKKFCPNLQKNNQEFVIGYAGRISSVKNVIALVNAFVKIAEKNELVKLKIIGGVFEKTYNDLLVQTVAGLKCRNKIEILSPTNNMPGFYNSLDLFVLPSHFEGTPNVLLEAMSCAIPCLISIGANSDGFLHRSYVFDQNNISELSEKIEWMINHNKDDFQIIGTKNREKILNEFSLEKMVQTYDSIINNV